MRIKTEQVTWHTGTIDEVYAKAVSSSDGISSKEAARRLEVNGLNELQQKKQKTIIQMFLAQFADPMVIILLLAVVLSSLLHEWIEAAVIFAIVLLNAAISVIQERRAANALESLRKLTAPTATVVRDGEQLVIPASQLVVGDVVMLEDGRIVPADLRLIRSSGFKVQESSLTGESVPVEKDSEALLLDSDMPLGDRSNMAYSSSVVMYGNGAGLVVSVGMDTEVGQVAQMLDDQDDYDTPLKRKLTAVGKTLSLVGLAVCVAIFTVGLLYGQELLPLFMIAIALAISVIPEGLPAVSTIVMALGVQRMAERSALVRKLPVIEALGSATVICSDKTGTLTENKMTVTKVALLDSQGIGIVHGLEEVERSTGFDQLAIAAVLCNNADTDPEHPGNFIGDPTEGALLALAPRIEETRDSLHALYPRIFEQPFDSHRKRMSVVHTVNERSVVYVKGAVDGMLDLCTYVMANDGTMQPISDADKAMIQDITKNMSKDALRVLGYAYREIGTSTEFGDNEDLEHALVFIGLTGMIDPPRKEVVQAVRACHTAGIRTIMITGDHIETAMAIGRELSIYKDGDTAFSGTELDGMADEELDGYIKTTTIFGRVSPSDKLRIIESLRRAGEITAMTGDGVNDAPALKAADIGVAMGITGTDVAKDAADMVLLDDNFTTIEYAIKEGRRIYGNIQKIIQFLLTGNASEVFVLFIATLFNWQTPILAVHILVINLATDSLPSVALGVEPSEKNSMKQVPIRSGSLFTKGLVTSVVVHGLFIATATLVAYGVGMTTAGYEVAVTMSFLVLAISQLFHAFSVRSATRSVFAMNHLRNPWLVVSLFTSSLIIATLMLVPFMRELFGLVQLSTVQWIFVGILSIMPLFFVELSKFVQFMYRRSQ